MANKPRIEFTLDDGDIIEVALEALIESYEYALSGTELSASEKRESKDNLRAARSALLKVQQLFRIPESL